MSTGILGFIVQKDGYIIPVTVGFLSSARPENASDRKLWFAVVKHDAHNIGRFDDASVALHNPEQGEAELDMQHRMMTGQFIWRQK